MITEPAPRPVLVTEREGLLASAVWFPGPRVIVVSPSLDEVSRQRAAREAAEFRAAQVPA